MWWKLKKLFVISLSASILGSAAFPHTLYANSHVYFSPKGGCTQAIVDELRHAKQSVLVQAYSFTSFPIAQALIDAEKRGVKVEAIIDKKQIHERKVKIGLIAMGGVSIYLDGAHAIAQALPPINQTVLK